MKLTVLGKYGPFPAAGGGTSSYLVRGENTAILLDFGSGAMGRLLRHMSMDDVDAIVLSHLHYDHMCDLLPLSYYLKAKDKRMKLIMPDTDCIQHSIINDLDGFDIEFTQPQMRVGEFALSFTRMVHPLESYSVKITDGIRTLFYSGDTSFCEMLPAAAQGSDMLLLDCGKAEGSNAPHLSLSEAVFLSRTLGVPAIASHLSPVLEYISSYSAVVIAEEGKTYRFDDLDKLNLAL